MSQGRFPPLIKALQNPALYDHPISGFEIIETHISWVLLTGPYAYKIKKPVNLGFLDFSTLEKRRHFCEEELRLNRRLAPSLYLAIINVTGTPESPILNGPGPAIEYAVKMKQFPQEAQFNRMLERGELTPQHIDELADIVAHFHRTAAVAPDNSIYGTTAQVWHPVEENFRHIRPALDNPQDIACLQRIEAWARAEHTRLLPAFEARKRQGRIRECHGDMHLRNIALLDGKPVIFDCIEFNDEFRWIDVISEVAFFTMDLYDRNHPALAHRFLNAYLQKTGDYEGLWVLRYYQVYRALVRAKVACIQMGQLEDIEARINTRESFLTYLVLAEHYTKPQPIPLMITHGLSGSGKTAGTQTLLETDGAIRLRSDVERKRLFGLPATARTKSDISANLYTADATEKTYGHLAHLAEIIIQASYPAIVDATFLKRRQRTVFRELAATLNVPFVILDFTAPEAVLRARILARLQEGIDPSEANLEVLEHQLATQEPLTSGEAARILTINTFPST